MALNLPSCNFECIQLVLYVWEAGVCCRDESKVMMLVPLQTDPLGDTWKPVREGKHDNNQS